MCRCAIKKLLTHSSIVCSEIQKEQKNVIHRSTSKLFMNSRIWTKWPDNQLHVFSDRNYKYIKSFSDITRVDVIVTQCGDSPSAQCINGKGSNNLIVWSHSFIHLCDMLSTTTSAEA